MSHRAEAEYRSWLESLAVDVDLAVVEIDVIEEKPLARGLTMALDVRHESPQVLWFEAGELRWHGSHEQVTVERLATLLEGDGSGAV